MAIIVSGGGTEPLKSSKKRKKREEQAPSRKTSRKVIAERGPQAARPRVQAAEAPTINIPGVQSSINLENLVAAYYQRHKRYPSPDKAQLFLQLGGDRLRSVDEWIPLLDPESLLSEVTGAPTGKEAVAKAEQAQAIEESREQTRLEEEASREIPAAFGREERVLPEAKPVGVEGYPTRGRYPSQGIFSTQARNLMKDDFDPINEVRDSLGIEGSSKTLLYTATGKPAQYAVPLPESLAKKISPRIFEPAPMADVGGLEDSIRFISVAQSESNDLDRTPAEKAEHDIITFQTKELMREVAQRRTWAGMANNFDPEGQVTEAFGRDYRQLIGMGQLAYIVFNDHSEEAEKKATKAMNILGKLYKIYPGDSVEDVWNTVIGSAELMQKLEISDEDVLDFCYKGFMVNRPFGQTEDKGRLDYAFEFGPDKLPKKASEQYQKQTTDVNRLLNIFFDKTMNVGGVMNWGMDTAERVLNSPIDLALRVSGNDPKGASTFVDAVHYVTKGITHFDAPGLIFRPICTFAEIFDVAFEEGEGIDTFAKAEEWHKAWDKETGPGLMTKLVDELCEDNGWDIGNAPWVGELATWFDFGLGLYVIGKGSGAMNRAAGKALRGAWKPAHGMAQKVVGKEPPPPKSPLAEGIGVEKVYTTKEELAAGIKPEGKGPSLSDKGTRADNHLRPMCDPEAAAFPMTPEQLTRTKFHPGDVTDPAVLNDMARQVGIPENGPKVIRTQFAIDEASSRALRDMGVEIPETKTPFRSRDPIEGAVERLKVEGKYDEFFSRTMDHLDDVLKERGLYEPAKTVKKPRATKTAEGVKVRETRVGKVDASIAEDINIINEAGYRTRGSHGLPQDHPKGHPARNKTPYVEFDLADLGPQPRAGKRMQSRKTVQNVQARKLKDIRDAAQKTGMKVVAETKDGRTLVRVEGKAIHDFTEALTGKSVEVPVKPKKVTVPIEEVLEPPTKKHRLPRFMWSHAEQIAYGMHDEAVIAATYGVPAIDEFRPILTELARAKTPDAVIDIMSKPESIGIFRDGFDLSMPGLVDSFLAKNYAETLGGEVGRVAFTPIGLSNPVGMIRDAHVTCLNVGRATKCGKLKPTAADWAEMRGVANKIWRSTNERERAMLLRDYSEKILRNMESEGRLDGFNKWVTKRRAKLAEQISAAFDVPTGGKTHGRAYTGDFRTTSKHPIGELRSAIDDMKEELRSLAADASPEKKAELEAGIKHADAMLAELQLAADIVSNRKKPSAETMSMQRARDVIDSYTHPSPLLMSEGANTVRLAFDPRLLAWYQAGKPLKALIDIDIAFHGRLMNFWRMAVMGTVSFPFRVLSQDELARLIPEGLLPGTARWAEAMAVNKELIGGKNPFTGKYLRLDKAENAELSRLSKLEKPTAEEAARLRELRGKAESPLTVEQMDEIINKGGDEWTALLDDHFQEAVPGTRQHLMELPRHLRKMSREPVIKHFLKTDLRERGEIRAWLVKFLCEDNKSAASLRLELVNRGFIDAKGATPHGMRKLLRMNEPIGSAGNMARFVEAYTDICYKIGADHLIRTEVKTPGSLSPEEFRSIPPEHLWNIPSNRSGVVGRGVSGYVNAFTKHPMKAWYELVTNRIMEGATMEFRRLLFSDGYARYYRSLTEAGVKEELASRIAYQRGIQYANQISYARNPTVLEDALRNYIPFIHSYRKFSQYWLKTLAKYPYAMAAAYKMNPQSGQYGITIGGTTYYGLPLQTFWMQEEGGINEVLKSGIPNIEPGAASAIYGMGNKFGFNVENVPGLTGGMYNPFGGFKALLYGLGVPENDVTRLLVGDTSGYETEHAYNIKEFASGKGKPVTGKVEVEWPEMVSIIDALTFHNSDRPEFVWQGLTRIFSPFGTEKVYSKRVTEIRDGMRLIGDPMKVAKYRETHPDFDTLQSFYEARTDKERAAILSDHPWVADYAISTTDKETGLTTFSTADYLSAREEGAITTVSSDEELKNIARRRIAVWGKGEPGDTDFKPGYLTYQEAEEATKKKLKKAEKWAEQVAKEESHGSKFLYDDLMRQWRTFQPGVNDREHLWGVFHKHAKQDAKKQGMSVDEFERSVSPYLINQTFRQGYGDRSPTLTGERASHADIEKAATLIESGIMPWKDIDWWLRTSEYTTEIQQEISKRQEKRLQNLVDTTSESFFDFDSWSLRSLGVPANEKTDAAIAETRRYYYTKYKPVVDKCGSQSKEGRRARLAWNAYKDKTLGSAPGGEALVGGLADRIINIPYFMNMNRASVASKHQAVREQKYFEAYKKEVMKLKPDPERLEKFHKHFTPYDEERYQEFMRVNHMLYVTGMARHYRDIMKHSYSEYYQGPGNSAYSAAGQKMVNQLSQLIRSLIRQDKQRWGASDFGKQINKYYESPHSFAWNALEWYEH